MKFEWDTNKQQQNQQKHEISFEEATTVWTDPLALIAPDPTHSIIEKENGLLENHMKVGY